MKLLLCIFALVAVSTASPALNETEVGGCTINSYIEVSSVVSNCKSINVGSFGVPAGSTLKLHLQAGTVLKFNGKLGFAYAEWDGPLVWIKGDGITVQGGNNHLINGNGHLWWDGYGDNSTKKKPSMMLIQATGNSVFEGIKIKDCPHTCIGISDSHDITLQNWDIDNKNGDTQGGANNDGFDISRSYKITIKDTNVWNQDDCICVNQGQDLWFENIHCTGSHGLSLAAGIYQTYDDNTISNVTFRDSVVENSKFAIHIKTIAGDQKGEISSITYDNIKVSGISSYGINVQQDYTNDGSTGNPKGNIQIKDLTINNISGTLEGTNSTAVYILCGSGGCSNWKWSNINLQGASQSNSCNFAPSGFVC